MTASFDLAKQPVRKHTQGELLQEWHAWANWPVGPTPWMRRRLTAIENELRRRDAPRSAPSKARQKMAARRRTKRERELGVMTGHELMRAVGKIEKAKGLSTTQRHRARHAIVHHQLVSARKAEREAIARAKAAEREAARKKAAAERERKKRVAAAEREKKKRVAAAEREKKRKKAAAERAKAKAKTAKARAPRKRASSGGTHRRKKHAA